MRERPVGLILSSPDVPLEGVGFVAVGECRTSVIRAGGSFRLSAFHIPVPQENDPLPDVPQFTEDAKPGLVPAPHAPWSVAGVVGFEFEFAGENELLAVKDAFRGNELGTSLSQDMRRAGFAICGG